LGGARPKAVLVTEGSQWIAKFPARNDPFDIPVIERATLELARRVGLDVAPTRLVTLGDARKVMLIQRFDRGPLSQAFPKRHMVSALTTLGVHEQDSSRMRYADIARAIEQIGGGSPGKPKAHPGVALDFPRCAGLPGRYNRRCATE